MRTGTIIFREKDGLKRSIRAHEEQSTQSQIVADGCSIGYFWTSIALQQWSSYGRNFSWAGQEKKTFLSGGFVTQCHCHELLVLLIITWCFPTPILNKSDNRLSTLKRFVQEYHMCLDFYHWRVILPLLRPTRAWDGGIFILQQQQQ